MSYSRAIEGVQDARALAAVFARVRLALVRDADGVCSVRSALPALPLPAGRACAVLKTCSDTNTAVGVCRSLPSRTSAALVFSR
jgi:hypothetical protein